MAMDIGGNISDTAKLQSGFKKTVDGIKYLGIHIPPSSEKLYNFNYKSLIHNISKDLDRWSVLPLSLVGRIESVRMNVLPKLVYLFQM